MAESKKSKHEPVAASDQSLAESTWETVIGLADDARTELHKQAAALIAVTEGAFVGATRFAGNINDRLDELARESLAAGDRAGRQLVASLRTSAHKVTATTQQIAATTQKTARGAAERATATARVLVRPAAEGKKKAA